MTKADSERGFSWLRLIGVLSLLIATFSLLSCSRIAKYSDQAIPQLLTPADEADFPRLLTQLKPFTDLLSLRATHVSLQFTDSGSAERYRRADAIFVVKRPQDIRIIIQVPIAHTKLAEMVSDAQQFKVAIYYDKYKRFLMGTNNADYSKWKERLEGKKESQSAFVNARPFHFTEALLIQPLHLSEPGFMYSIQEELVEEPDSRPGAKKGARVLRTFYALSEFNVTDQTKNLALLKRRFWFDRNEQLHLKRQQIFDDKGKLITDIRYSNYMKLSTDSQLLRPSVIGIQRPYDKYSAELNFLAENVEVNIDDLPASAFTLENTDKLPVTNLDQPQP